jgi:hypothetical protein
MLAARAQDRFEIQDGDALRRHPQQLKDLVLRPFHRQHGWPVDVQALERVEQKTQL